MNWLILIGTDVATLQFVNILIIQYHNNRMTGINLNKYDYKSEWERFNENQKSQQMFQESSTLIHFSDNLLYEEHSE